MTRVRNITDQPHNKRTIISAVNPRRFEDTLVYIIMTVWFEELSGPVDLTACPFDCEYHIKELWMRAMAGEYGEIEVIPMRLEGRSPTILLDRDGECHVALFDHNIKQLTSPVPMKLLPSPPKMLEYHGKP